MNLVDSECACLVGMSDWQDGESLFSMVGTLTVLFVGFHAVIKGGADIDFFMIGEVLG